MGSIRSWCVDVFELLGFSVYWVNRKEMGFELYWKGLVIRK